MPNDSSKAQNFLVHLEPLQKNLAAYARRMLNRSGDVPDVLQETVTTAFDKFDMYAEGTNFRAWIFKHLNYQILNFNRKATGLKVFDESTEPQTHILWEQIVVERNFQSLAYSWEHIREFCDEKLDQAVSELPETERCILLLRSIGEFKYREISEILSLPVGTVMSYLSRSRARLRTLLIDDISRKKEDRDHDIA